MRRVSSLAAPHLQEYTRTSFSLISKDFISHLSSLPSTTSINTNEPLSPQPSDTHLKSRKKTRALLFSNVRTQTFNTLADQNPPQLSSRQRKIREKSQLEEAFQSAKTIQEMLQVFQEMETSFDERELGLSCLRIGLKLDQEGEYPEKALSFANRALKVLDINDKLSLPLAMTLQLLGSACYSLKRFNDSLGYLNRSNRVLVN